MADAMLGRLTRWLRILGYDTAYEKVISDEALVERVLIGISPDEARPLVPPFVARQNRTFHHCPQCGRVFWSGTHWRNIRRRIAAITDTCRADPS